MGVGCVADGAGEEEEVEEASSRGEGAARGVEGRVELEGAAAAVAAAAAAAAVFDRVCLATGDGVVCCTNATTSSK